MDFGDIALVALIGGGIYYYVNLPEEAFTDTVKFPVTTNQDGTKSQTRTADDGSKVEVMMKNNQFFRKTVTPAPDKDGNVSAVNIVITFYNAEGKSITAEEWTNDVVLSETALTGLQTAGGYVGNGGNSSDGPATTLPTPMSQEPRPPATLPNSFPAVPGGYMPNPPPPEPSVTTQQPDGVPNPGYVQQSGFPVPSCVATGLARPTTFSWGFPQPTACTR
jgi:hypothetical protein